ncbi:MAG: flagellar basal body rod protein FlgC [Caulobacteraceae bacterium]|nr:flagellar basal body rod protein FlgC [Caulobacteraceae bacterium]MBV9509325.1 flagellar basal body rod protein FlgC [Caulobacteraceae bacterium]
MSSMGAMSVAASALRAEQQRMRVIAENMANADSVSTTPGGDPYQRQIPVFTPITVEGGVQGVAMSRVAKDTTPFRTQYQPGNPSADAKGYVKLPNVDPLIESLDMRDAQRAYESNLSVIETARQMQENTLDIIKK